MTVREHELIVGQLVDVRRMALEWIGLHIVIIDVKTNMDLRIINIGVSTHLM
jgi:hypothetical protein